MTLSVDELTGTLDTRAGTAIVGAGAPNLVLGNLCISDDPTFFNTAGGISINDFTVGGKLAIFARDDIAPGTGDELCRSEARTSSCVAENSW